MIKVLIVDDHDLVRTGLVKMLSEAPNIQIVGEANNGEKAIALARELSPHVILMDIRMPEMDGVEATRKILRHDDSIRILAVTMCEEEPFPSRLLKAGAAGYLTKGADLAEMLRAIRLVNAGQRYISPQIAQAMALRPYVAPQVSPAELLSDRELQVMMMICQCHRVQEISDRLCLSPKTVNTYRKRIIDKLDVYSDVEMVMLAIRWGMVDAAATV